VISCLYLKIRHQNLRIEMNLEVYVPMSSVRKNDWKSQLWFRVAQMIKQMSIAGEAAIDASSQRWDYNPAVGYDWFPYFRLSELKWGFVGGVVEKKLKRKLPVLRVD